ncbi:hypothetical protein [Burkholderia gladioli]|uniref:hypothetical protein n=1 Tax=Burkholderia gladioli TaxID=28095 RepID=UPI0016419B6C|nr:hypothetical protein [Burkholderia gladioli]
MKLSALADTCTWTFGLLLDADDLLKQAINATRYYLAWGSLASVPAVPDTSTPPPTRIVMTDAIVGYWGGIYGGVPVERPVCPVDTPIPAPVLSVDLSGDTDITDSEWGLIRPLFMLYVERENGRGLEASRVEGVDPYGRSVDQVESDIRQYEGELPRLAFGQDYISI